MKTFQVRDAGASGCQPYRLQAAIQPYLLCSLQVQLHVDVEPSRLVTYGLHDEEGLGCLKSFLCRKTRSALPSMPARRYVAYWLPATLKAAV